tara:strand:+ start:61 stop:543 length:483 start_codon:yes stop_codon:yes gene_type:complete
MATTIIPANLTVNIVESYSLNGVDYGNSMTKTYIDNGQVSQRVMSIAGKGTESSVFTDILELSTVDGQGQVVKADYKYFRINNLDTVNTLNLRFLTTGTEYVSVKVLPASTFLLMDNGLDVTSSAAGAITFTEITKIAGQSSSETEAIDVEFVMVTGVTA